MKKIIIIFSLLFFKSMQSGFDEIISLINDQKNSQNNLKEIYPEFISTAIKTYDSKRFDKALNNRKREITDHFNFYNKTLTTYSSKQKLESTAELITQVTFEKENYKVLVRLAENNLPNITKIEKEVEEQKNSSIWKGLFGLGMLFSASGFGWLAKHYDSLEYGNLLLPNEIGTFYGLLTLGGLCGLSGFKNIFGAINQNVSADKKLKNIKITSQKATKNLAEIQKKIDDYNFFGDCDKDFLKNAKEFACKQGLLKYNLMECISYFFQSGAQWYLTELSMKKDLMEAELESLKAATECNEKAAIWYETNSSGNVTEYQEVIGSEEEQESEAAESSGETEPVPNGDSSISPQAFNLIENGIN